MRPSDRKKAIYLQQALSEMERGVKLHYSDDVRKNIDKAVALIDADLMGYEDGMVLVRTDVRALLKQRTEIIIDGKSVSVNPFESDIIDELRHLEALDPDYAKDRNGEGFGKNTAFKARRILSQFDDGRLTSRDLFEGEEVAVHHRDQMTGVYVDYSGLDPDEVESIIQSRLQSGDISWNDRIAASIDDEFSFIDSTYLYTDEDGLAVHVAAGSPEPLVRYRKEHEQDGAFLNFYGNGQQRFDPDRMRTVNGEQVRYPSLIFPSEPKVAADLISIVKKNYPHALIETGVKRLAALHDPDFDPRPSDGNDPKGFRR